jgi:hypothetical protein
MSNGGNFSPVWPGPALLVPVTVDCLLVGQPDSANSTWALTQMNYANLANGFLPDTAPPLTPRLAGPPPGALLLWTLPYGLRHGEQQQDGPNAGKVEFLLVPNRWLILRAQYGAAGQAPQLVAGVLHSDLLSDLDPNAAEFPDPANPTGMPKQIGRYVPLSNWDGPAGPAAPFLRAIGPGDVSWAVTFDNVSNVFAFHDALPEQSGTYAYSVIGWYATPSDDPLNAAPNDPAGWQIFVSQRFGWAVGDVTVSTQDVTQALADWQSWQAAHGLDGPFDPSKLKLPPQLLKAMQTWIAWQAAHGVSTAPSPLPQQILCHGMVSSIQWNGSAQSYGTGAPGGGKKFPTVAVGNTAPEAIAAWLAYEVVQQGQQSPDRIPTIERAVEAFQKGVLLELQRDPVAAEAQLHQARFEAAGAAQEWIVFRPRSGAEGEFGGQHTVPLDQKQTDLLVALNSLQRQHDQQVAARYTLRNELFALDYKSSNLPRGAPPAMQTLIAQAFAAIQGAIGTANSAIGDLENRIATARGQLTGLLGTDFVLQAVTVPPSSAPVDPVVTVVGSGADTKFAPAGTYDEDKDLLFTRFTGQTVTGITVSDTVAGQSVSATLGAAELLDAITLPQGNAIPKEAQDLWLEMVLLDPANAQLLAQLFYTKIKAQPPAGAIAALAKNIATQQTLVWNYANYLGVDEEAIAAASGLQGELPAKVGVEFCLGQPWTPVYLDWKVRWFPTSMDAAGELSQWTLGDIDYSWTGSQVVPPPQPIEFVGRTVLNNKIAQDLKAQFAQFKNDPDYAGLDQDILQALEELALIMGQSDVMTQSLSGFTKQLATQVIAPNQSVDPTTVGPLLGDSPIGFRPVVNGTDYKNALPFFPIRAGHFQLIDLWVVDVFGQILRGKDPSLGNDAPIPNLILAQSVTTPGSGNTTYVQLPPRVSQPARLNLDLLGAGDDTVPSNSADLTSPICGWVMPNHLDNSLMVFDAAGNNLGAVIEVITDVQNDKPGNTGLRWDAVPGSQSPLGAPPELPNAHLQAFIANLLDQGLQHGADPLNALLDHIDSSLWTMSKLAPQERNLAILLGPPIAVVRAEVSLSLYGNPAYNQSWSETGRYYLANGQYKPLPVPFQSVGFAVRIGDLGYNQNGAMGYFAADDYTRFYAVYGSGSETAAVRRAMRRGAPLRPALLAPPPARESLDGNGYVETGHLVQLSADASTVKLTLLVDPRGYIPTISGVLPATVTNLAPGPTTQALRNMTATFRVGPLLTDPQAIRMPLPAEVRGNWGWMARHDVTTWGEDTAVKNQDAVARLGTTPLRLSEGWLTLSGAASSEPNK